MISKTPINRFLGVTVIVSLLPDVHCFSSPTDFSCLPADPTSRVISRTQLIASSGGDDDLAYNCWRGQRWTVEVPVAFSTALDRRSVLTGSTLAIAAASCLTIPAPAVGAKTNIPDWALERNVKMPVLALNTVGLSVEDTEYAVALAW